MLFEEQANRARHGYVIYVITPAANIELGEKILKDVFAVSNICQIQTERLVLVSSQPTLSFIARNPRSNRVFVVIH